MLYIFVILIVILVALFVLYYNHKESFLNYDAVFKAPKSLTIIESGDPEFGSLESGSELEYNDLKLLLNIPTTKIEKDGNTLEYPSFFHAAEKWPGCISRPLFQGTCGSCWAFAAVTVLSSRFYIESCGLSGCRNYPQINFGSINNVNFNINEIYKFRKLFLTDVFNNVDTSKEGKLSKNEWISVIKEYQNTFKSQSSPYFERHQIAQILVYLLNFQSLGSIDLTNTAKVIDRAEEAFTIWLSLINRMITKERDLDNYKFINVSSEPIEIDNSIDINYMKSFWLNEPVTLSAEKLISCCNTCRKLDFKTENRETGNPVCMGSTLDDAWAMLRESGTPTVDCIGYNLDTWTEGSYTPSCKEIQGPVYSFCSGYVIDKSNFQIGDRNGSKSLTWSKDIDAIISNYENSDINPVAIPNTEKNVPWVDPQLFRFRAKNVYKVNSKVSAIQREILERGPVSTGYTLYPDFQNNFGTTGGQLYTDLSENPLGSSRKHLIYKWNGKGEPIGGHSIVIVGWGQYTYVNNNVTYDIPYWICLNSWGYKWGTSGISPYDNRNGLPDDMTSGGYFWIIRGTNECSIESNVIVGQPDINNISYPKVSDRYGWGLPPPDEGYVKYIKQENLEGPIELGPNNVLVYNKPKDGGGSFTFRNNEDGLVTWSIDSMVPPSPFVLFWNSSRPIFCIGSTTNEISESSTNQIIQLNNEAFDSLSKIVEIQKNPLIVIDDEQVQLIQLDINNDKKSMKVLRGINNSYMSKHKTGAELKVIPYKNLSVVDLDRISKRCSIETVMVE